MKRLILAVALIASPALAMKAKVVDESTMPVPKAEWDALVAENLAFNSCIDAKDPRPFSETVASFGVDWDPFTTAYNTAIMAAYANNYAEFKDERATFHTYKAKLGATIPNGGC